MCIRDRLLSDIELGCERYLPLIVDQIYLLNNYALGTILLCTVAYQLHLFECRFGTIPKISPIHRSTVEVPFRAPLAVHLDRRMHLPVWVLLLNRRARRAFAENQKIISSPSMEVLHVS